MKSNAQKTILLTGILLGGCASDGMVLQEPQATIQSARTNNTLPLTMNTPLDSRIPLTLKQAWPLFYKESHHGTYLQKITTHVQDQDFTITVHLSISENRIEFIALNDLYGRIYSLVWTPDTITWIASEHLPETVHPENIMIDFLLVHLPMDTLKNNLDSNIPLEESVQNSKKILKSGNIILREIKNEGPLGPFWKLATLHNPEFGYSLDIQTVRLP